MAVHVIQSYPSNNLNRGEDGSPKSCIFGGVRRSRVSSQCIKRNARLAMYDVISENDENGMGIRTKTMPAIIAGLLGSWAESAENVTWTDDEMEKQKYHEAAKEFDIRDVSHALTAVGMQIDAKKNHTLKSVYCTNMKQCEAFAKAMLEIGSKRAGEDKDGNLKLNPYDTKTELPALDDALDSSISLDIMMFGRMQAGRPIHNVEACIQVGHEFSTHRAEEEFDYFTAVDDAKSMLKEQGSAHLDHLRDHVPLQQHGPQSHVPGHEKERFRYESGHVSKGMGACFCTGSTDRKTEFLCGNHPAGLRIRRVPQ